MASGWYNKGKYHVLNSTINLSSDTIKVMLVTSSYTFNADHDFISDVSANELSVTGYTGGFGGSGRKTLTGKSITEDDTNDRAYFTASNVTWATLSAGQTIGGAILMKEVTTNADSPLIAFVDLVDTATNGGDITIAWNAGGILRLA